MLHVLYTVFLQVQKQVPEKIIWKTHLQYHTVFTKRKSTYRWIRTVQIKVVQRSTVLLGCLSCLFCEVSEHIFCPFLILFCLLKSLNTYLLLYGLYIPTPILWLVFFFMVSFDRSFLFLSLFSFSTYTFT